VLRLSSVSASFMSSYLPALPMCLFGHCWLSVPPTSVFMGPGTLGVVDRSYRFCHLGTGSGFGLRCVPWRSTSAPGSQLSAKPRVDGPGAGVEPTRRAQKARIEATDSGNEVAWIRGFDSRLSSSAWRARSTTIFGKTASQLLTGPCI
jgi:hypothetical protein